MIPYKDDNPTSIFPFVTIGIIVLNCLAFAWELFSPVSGREIALAYGAIPSNILSLTGDQPLSPVATVFTSMFLHGGFMHLGGNMLYLWIFGNNIEDSLGHGRFILFYLFCGVAAAYGYAVVDPHSTMPMIGASGAISGILGAYALLFPKARVHTILILGIFLQIIQVPALVVIGFWAVFQLLNGILSQGVTSGGGVAWFAHVGGFLAGILTIRLWLPGRRPTS